MQYKKEVFFFPPHHANIYLCVLITNLLQTNLYKKSADNEFCWRGSVWPDLAGSPSGYLLNVKCCMVGHFAVIWGRFIAS